MIKTTNLAYTYGGAAATALRFPDINIGKGQHTLILGQSGCGKTTLLHLLAGILTSQQGSIVIDNQDVTKLSGAKADAWRGKNIGLVFQQTHLIQSLTVEENLFAAQHFGGQKPDAAFATKLLTILNINEKRKALPNQLSHGQRQRVAIARALINRPKLILADEPTSALDDHHCEEVFKLLISSAQEADSTLLIVTHDNRLTTKLESVVRIG